MDDRPTGIKKSYLIVPCLAISIASRPDPESAVNGDSTVTCKQTKKAKDKDYLGVSPRSSGYARRLMFQRSRV